MAKDAPAGPPGKLASGDKRPFWHRSGTRSRRWRGATLLLALSFILFGVYYGFYVNRRLDEVHGRHVRLLGNAADRLEDALALTLESAKHLSRDLGSLDRFLGTQPYLDLVPENGPSEADPATVASEFTRSSSTDTVFVTAVPRLKVVIRDLAVADLWAVLPEQIVGDLQARADTKVVSDGDSPAMASLEKVVEVLRVNLALPEDLELDESLHGHLQKKSIVAGEKLVLLLDLPSHAQEASAEESSPASHQTLPFWTSPQKPFSGGLVLEQAIEVRFEDMEEPTGGARAVFEDGSLRASGLGEVFREELELSSEQASKISRWADPGEVALTLLDAECGRWVFEDHRPLVRIDRDPGCGEEGWNRRSAHRQGRRITIDEAPESEPPKLGFFSFGKRLAIPEDTDLQIGCYCPAVLEAGGEQVGFESGQQQLIEAFVRRLGDRRAAEGKENPPYREEIGKLDLAVLPDPGSPQRLQLEARLRWEELLELRLSPLAKGLLQHLAPPASTGAPDGSPRLFQPEGSPDLRLEIPAPRRDSPQQTGLAADGRELRLEVEATAADLAIVSSLLEDRNAEFEIRRVDHKGRPEHQFVGRGLLEHQEIELKPAEGKTFSSKPAELPSRLHIFEQAERRLLRLLPKEGQAKELTFEVDLDAVVRSPLLDAAFSSYLVADEKGDVFVQVWPSAAPEVRGQDRIRRRSGVRFKSLPPDLSVRGNAEAGSAGEAAASGGGDTSSGGRTARSTARDIAGVDLELICQPFRLRVDRAVEGLAKPKERPEIWKLCGLVDQGEEIREALGLAPYMAAALALLFLFGWLSLPFLRFLFMERDERLRRGDVLLLLAGTWLTLAVLTLLLSAFYRHQDLSAVLDDQLRVLAETVRSNLRSDLGASLYLLDHFNREAAEAFAMLPVSSCPTWDPSPRRVPEVVGLLEGDGRGDFWLPPPEDREVPPFTSVFWLDRRGRQLAKATVSQQNTPPVAVPEREYFRAVREGRFWAPEMAGSDENQPFYFDTYRSKTTGEHEAALSIPSSVRLDTCGPNAEPAAVAVLTGLPPSLRAPVVSPPLGFAVIDPRGATLFHSQPGRALTSHLLEEIEDPERLAAAMAARRVQELDSVYFNRSHRLRVEPLVGADHLPGGLPQWWLVTFYDKELVRTVVVEATLRALLPTLLSGVVLGFVLVTIRRRIQTALWPSPAKTDHYLVLGLVYLIVVLVQWRALSSAAVTDSPWWVLLLYLVLPLACLLGSAFALTRRGGAGSIEQGQEDPTADPAQQGAIRRGAERTIAGIETVGIRPVFGQRDTVAYLVGIILLWLVLGVLPAAGFSARSWSTCLGVVLERDALATVEGLAVRRNQNWMYLQGLRIANPSAAAGELSRTDDLYLFSAAAELRAANAGDRAFAPTPSSRWTLRFLRHLPIYNSVSRSFRYLESEAGYPAARELFERSAEGEVRLSLEKREADLLGVKDKVDLRKGKRAEGSHPHGDLVPLLVLVLVALLAVWVWHISNHLCFSRLNVGRRLSLSLAEFEARVRSAHSGLRRRRKAKFAAEPPARGFIAVVTDPAHLGELAALGEPADLSGAEEAVDGNNAGAGDQAPQVVVCKHLEAGLEEPAARQRKLDRLKALLTAGHVVLLVCPRSPDDLLAPAMPGAGEPADSSGESRWRLAGEEAAVWPGILRELEEVFVTVTNPQAAGSRREATYLAMWANCSESERLALLQLAEEGFLNPQQIRSVETVLARGLLKLQPILEFADPDFRRFVLSRFRESSDLRGRERTARSAGWGSFRKVFGFALVAIVIFLFVTERELFNLSLAVLGALGAALPALLAFLGSLRGGGSAS